MKRKILAVCICSICLLAMNGCGKKETNVTSADIVEIFNEKESDDSSKDAAANEEIPDTQIDTIKFTDEMNGEVVEIISAEKTVIVSRVYVEGEEENIAVAPIPGNEELVSIYFMDDAKYVLETGKADGSDVTRQEADFSSIQAGDVLSLKGKENTVGTEFLATEVEIVRVID